MICEVCGTIVSSPAVSFPCGHGFLCHECRRDTVLLECSPCRVRHFDRALATSIHERHEAQTLTTYQALQLRYQNRPVLGRPILVWDLLAKTRQCIDPSDRGLCGIDQFQHVLQVLANLEAKGRLEDEVLFCAAVLHDLGKMLLLMSDEDPANVVCFNKILIPGKSLDQTVITWNHDEFMYSRIKDVVPYEVSWIVRYHSLRDPRRLESMNARDVELWDRYMVVFQQCDLYSKSPEKRVPTETMLRYQERIQFHFPLPLYF